MIFVGVRRMRSTIKKIKNIQAVLVAGLRAAVHRAGARAETRKADLSVGRIDLFVEVG